MLVGVLHEQRAQPVKMRPYALESALNPPAIMNCAPSHARPDPTRPPQQPLRLSRDPVRHLVACVLCAAAAFTMGACTAGESEERASAAVASPAAETAAAEATAEPMAKGPEGLSDGTALDSSAASAEFETNDSTGVVEARNAELAALQPHASSKRQLPTGEPRVYAKTRNVWIRGRPTTDTQWIGFLWWGDSLPLRELEPIAGPGCSTFYAVEPRGYVCVDGKRATLDANDPVVSGTFPYSHDASKPNPHPHYGETRGGYRYVDLPTERTQRAKEWDYRFRMAWVESARNGEPRHEQILGVDLTPAKRTSLLLPELPRNLQMPHRKLVPRSTVAWSAEVLHEGRTFLLTDDLAWVPKDQVVPYPEIDYRGVHLTDEVQLPLALIRKRDCPAYAIEGDTVTETDKTYPRLGWVSLTGETKRIDRRTFWQTKHGDWLAEDEAVIPQPRDKTPWGAPLFEPDTTEKQPRGRQTWIQISILGGWLVAFEGTRPVFVTLMSPGSGGPPHGDRDPLETASTPTGWFTITGKFVTATMIAPNDLVHSAVPWAQNFSGPYAIHGAYWHNDWGQPKSGGCINLSPQDAQWMFEFTEPEIPPGWHGVRWLPKLEPSTRLIIGR